MSFARRLRGVTASLLIISLGACGGGSPTVPGPDPQPVVPVRLAVLKALLRGDLETVPVDADAQAAILIDLRSDGQLAFGCAVQQAWVGDVTAMHVHRGAVGVDGPPVVDLLSGGAAFSVATLAASDTLSIAPALAAEIAGTPGDFYVNIHTNAALNGLVRQQLSADGPIEALATLRGSEELSVIDPTARGACVLSVGADLGLDYVIAMRNPPVTSVMDAHVHIGPAMTNGDVLVNLAVGSATVDGAKGTLTGRVVPTLEQIARVCNALDRFYVNVHTLAAPAGVARGQLGAGPAEFWMPLTAAEESVPPSDPNGRGGATLHFDSLTTGRVHLAVPPAQGIGNVMMAHVHEGTAMNDGPPVIFLHTGADYVHNTASFSAEGEISCTPELLARMLANPAAFYVNLHTAADPSGAVRGQLSQEPVTFFTSLDGANEVPPAVPAGMGTASVIATGAFRCSFSVLMTTPPATDVTAGHVHDGDAGVGNGIALIDLLGAADLSVSASSITGSTGFTGRTLARMLAAPELFYVNMHTAAAPAGVARGQLSRLTQDAPPAISYDTPVTYTEGTPITENVPTSIGGAVSSYAVSPPLPAGLVLNTTTGVISGTPVGAAAAADYTVTASNAAGDAMATVNITVDPIAPTGLSYASPVTYTVGTAIAANTPSNGGGMITGYSVSPALPGGLTLNTTTGVITGTPTTATAQATYTVTGSNGAGSSMFGISITVDAMLQAPSGLSYSSPVSYGTGTAITPNNPTIGGGAATSWGVSPALPTGLSLNTSTGVISGTPTQVTAAANYTVTATNGAGSTNATVNIEITLGAPANLSYSPQSTIGYINVPIMDMSPSSSGGAVSSYAISPALSAGLTFSTTTGVISGTPTATSAQTTYTITASNATGMTTAQVQIVVY